jgi:ectoine hydroxylase
MRLSTAQVASYQKNGYLLLPGLLSAAEVEVLTNALAPLVGAENGTRTAATCDRDGIVYGVHRHSEPFQAVVRLGRVLVPANQLLDGRVYVHQTKVTLHTDHGDEGLPWRQDYALWRLRDRLPAPRVLTATVFLDDITTVNGPPFLVPGSHRGALLETETGVLNRSGVSEPCYARGIDVPLGPAGTVLYLHGKMIHGSSTNISPFPRRMLHVTYNGVDNLPPAVDDPSLDRVAAGDYAPVDPTGDGALLAHS